MDLNWLLHMYLCMENILWFLCDCVFSTRFDETAKYPMHFGALPSASSMSLACGSICKYFHHPPTHGSALSMPFGPRNHINDTLNREIIIPSPSSPTVSPPFETLLTVHSLSDIMQHTGRILDDTMQDSSSDALREDRTYGKRVNRLGQMPLSFLLGIYIVYTSNRMANCAA